MESKAGKVFLAFVLIFVLTAFVSAQNVGATLTGTVTESSGKALAGAKASARNVATGESTQAVTDSSGHYTIPNLAAGDYEVEAVAEGRSVARVNVTLAAGGQETVNLKLMRAQQSPPKTEAPSENIPNAPSSSQSAPSMEDLGFSKGETQADAARQALLDKRTRMLKIHQRVGLITTIPMIASVVTSFNAGGRSEGTASRDLHVALGALTGDLYGITAYYAIRAPKVPGTETRGPIKFHKTMAWIHGPGMIATPILGAIAFSQKNNGEKVHGIAQAHGPVAIVTAGAFGAALLSVSMKF
jgi:Carboxypeptidase regulatory-like domain